MSLKSWRGSGGENYAKSIAPIDVSCRYSNDFFRKVRLDDFRGFMNQLLSSIIVAAKLAKRSYLSSCSLVTYAWMFSIPLGSNMFSMIKIRILERLI